MTCQMLRLKQSQRTGALSESPERSPGGILRQHPQSRDKTPGRDTHGVSPLWASSPDPLSFPRPRIPGELGPEAPRASDPPLRPGLAVVEDVGRIQCPGVPPRGA